MSFCRPAISALMKPQDCYHCTQTLVPAFGEFLWLLDGTQAHASLFSQWPYGYTRRGRHWSTKGNIIDRRARLLPNNSFRLLPLSVRAVALYTVLRTTIKESMWEVDFWPTASQKPPMQSRPNLTQLNRSARSKFYRDRLVLAHPHVRNM